MKMMYGVIGYFIALAVVIFYLFRGCERTPQDVLTVGVVHGLPLGSSSDLHDGFNWDIAFFLGQKLHKQVKRKALLFTELDAVIQKGEVDVICASMNITDERLKKMAMVHLFAKPSPYVTLLFWEPKYKNEVKDCQRLRDMCNFFETHAIGVVEGVVWQSILQEYGIKKIKTYEYEHNALLGLEQGEVAAMIVGRVSTDFLLKQNSNLWSLQVALDKPYGYGIGVALNKESKVLIKQVAEALQELKGDGTINMLQLKWFGKVY